MVKLENLIPKKSFKFFLIVILFFFCFFISLVSAATIKVGYDSNPQPIINDNDSSGLNIGYDNGKINLYHYGNVSGGGGGVASGVPDYGNIALYNQSVTWTNGQNVSTGIGGWFKGAFNWVISSLVPSRFATFNGTTLWLNTTYFYNMTVLGGGSAFNATYDAHINNLTQHNTTYWYNQTTPAITYTNNYISSMNNTWTSTYNATYAQWAYNQTSASIGTDVYVKKSGDVMTGDLNLSGAKIRDNESGSYFGYTRENKFVFVYRKGA